MADSKLLATARDRYKRAIDHEEDNRKHALEVLKFRNGEHWPEKIKNERMNDPEGSRPCEVVDKTEQHLNQICNDERQNRPSIKVRPIDDLGDPEVAEVFQGIVRHIEDRSSADIAYDTAYEQAADAGFGYFRVLTEYADPMSFEQDIIIKRVRNRFQVVLDPDRQEPDGSDAQYGFIVEKMKKDEYEANYGKEHPVDFEAEGKNEEYRGWIDRDHVLVAEYFRIEHEKKTLCLWPDGSVSVKGEMPKNAAYAKPVRERVSRVPTVKWSKINGKEELEARDWPGKYIPIVEVVGKELDIEGKVHRWGLLKPAMGPQRMHDYAASAFIENVALAPRAPWTAAQGQLEGHEHEWRTANRRNLSVLTYKPILMDGNVPVPPPTRLPPPGIPVGWQQALLNSEHDIQSAMGRYDASLGADSNEKSGIALQKKQRESDAATFHFQDNLARSIRHCGRILIDLIPKIYDTKRIARILGEDGGTEQVMIDPESPVPVADNPDPSAKIKKIYNLNVGKYDVTVKVGPAFTTRREEAAEFMVNIASAAKDPATVQIATYLALKHSDMPGSDEAIKMLKKAMPPGMVEEEGEEPVPMVATPQGPIPAPAAGELISQLMQQVAQSDEQLKKVGDLQQIEQQVKDEAMRVELGKKDAAHLLERTKAAQREFELQQECRMMKERATVLEGEVQARDEQITQTEQGASEKETQLQQVGEAVAQVGQMVGDLASGMNEMRQEIGEGLKLVMKAALAPRKSTLEMDENGEPTGATSVPVLEEQVTQ